MLARGHRIARGAGLVGRSAEANNPILASDTALNPDWLPTPLLPETRCEAAVPIAAGEQVLGVLDVQQNVVGGLTYEDIDLLQSIANQAAIALLNARAYNQVQRQAAQEAQVTEIIQKIRATTTVEDALQTAVRELGRSSGAKQSVIRLGSPHENGTKNVS
jgi:GAF domain-containing protein